MKIIKIGFAALIASVLVGCGENITSNGFVNESSIVEDVNISTVDDTDVTNNIVVFKVGEKPIVKQEKSVTNEVIYFEQSNGVKLTSEDFLSHIESVCLQIFVEDNYIPVYGKCSPVVSEKYPAIEVKTNKLPETEFKAKIVGYKYNNTYWQGTNNSSVLGTTNYKVFDYVLVSFGLQEVYMGDIYSSYDIRQNIEVYDSTDNTDFSQINSVYILNEYGKEKVYNLYSDDDEVEFDFWVRKNVNYQMLCLESNCYKIPSYFDFFEGYLDISTAEKVEMVSVNSGSICSIKYNQDFHKTIDMSPDKYNFEHYFEIQDCNQSRYKFQFKFTEYDDLDINFNGRNDYVDGTYVEINPNSRYSSAWLYVKYIPNTDVEGMFFSPEASLVVFDTFTNEVVQEEILQLTTFEYINQ